MSVQGAIVVVATAWGSRHGGINSFSTALCRALAPRLSEHRLIVLVADATADDIADAAQHHVLLISLGLAQDARPSAENLASTMGRLAAAGISRVSWWIGHDVITGNLALAGAKQTGSRSAVIMHMNFAAYAFMKHDAERGGEVMKSVEAQREVLQSANVRFAVGPLLLQQLLEPGYGSGTPVMLVPGVGDKRTAPPAKERLHVITFGRFDAGEALVKQAMLAAAAFGRALAVGHQSNIRILQDADLTVLGAPPDVVSELKKRAEKEAKRVPNIKAVAFVDDRERLHEILHGSNVCLMLSWHEGFGLSAWEAIGAEVPVVLTLNSGVHRLLDSIGGHASGCIFPIDVRGRTDGKPDSKDIGAVCDALQLIASNLPKALENASRLRNLLRVEKRYTWDSAALVFAETLGLPVHRTPLDMSQASRGISGSIAPMDATVAHRTLRLASAYHKSGEYPQALSAIKGLVPNLQTPETWHLAIDATILEAELRLRLNHYSHARLLLNVAADEAAEREAWDRYVRAMCVENVIRRDTGDYLGAIELAESLLRTVEEHRLPPSLQEKVERALARSLALGGRGEAAVPFAERAVAGARRRSDPESLAPALLALGESLRHAGNAQPAIAAYGESRDIAVPSGDADCFLWATLGLSDALFLEGKVGDAEAELRKLQNYVTRPEHQHPLETLHYRLSIAALQLAAGAPDVDAQGIVLAYARLGIEWPSRYLEGVKAGRRPPKQF
jgi:glycosyltransferase involved in cell wall biosynthesis